MLVLCLLLKDKVEADSEPKPVSLSTYHLLPVLSTSMCYALCVVEIIILKENGLITVENSW